MPISFSHFPVNWRLPLYWIEVDPSQAGTPVILQPALLIGQMFAAGTATAGVPVPIGNLAQAKSLFGEGSMLERMVNTFIANNVAQQLWCLPVLEPGAGVAAGGSITVSHVPTQAGTLVLYIAGQAVSVAVGATDTTNTVALDIVAAINAMTTLPVTAALSASGGSQVNLTARWKGTTGNDIDIRDTFRGALGGEVLPASLTLTYSANKLSGGTGVPVFTTGITNMGDEQFEYVAFPFTDSTSLLALETEFGFGDSGRWGWMRQLYGHIFSATRDTYANLLTFFATRNTAQTSIMAVEVNAPSPVWEWAAAYDGQAARALTNDPARPLQTLELQGIVPAARHQRFLLTELNSLAQSGAATQKVSADSNPQILRDTTTYRLNLYSQADDAYTDVTILATLARLFRNQKTAITSKFPRFKLADDGTRFGPGQAIVTPKIIKAELISEYRTDEFNGLVERADVFKANLIVERDPNNRNRVNVLYPPQLVGALRIFAVLAQFRLQANVGADNTTLTVG